MNSQQMMEEINRLARLCEAKDTEYAKLLHSHGVLAKHHCLVDGQLSEVQARIAEKDATYNQLKETIFKSLDYTNEEMRELETKMAMQAEALKPLLELVKRLSNGIAFSDETLLDMRNAHDALSAASETVAAWRAKETEPLRREVAMAHQAIGEVCPQYVATDKMKNFLADTQATALAYEREVKAKVLEDAAKELDDRHLESLQMCILPSTMVREMATELRASKGEVK